jgi:D-glycero-D-manno-heptose 1,7-bisphosphate phosphatase
VVEVGRSAVRRAVFLDRDGVLVIPEFRDGRSFAPRRLEDLQIYPDAHQALSRLKAAGFLLAVVTNQPDVGNGLVSQTVVEQMNTLLKTQLPIDTIRACYHRQNEACRCRKPRPGMLLDSAIELGISLPDSFMVGDRASDIDAGRTAGCQTVFIDLGYTSERRPDNATFAVRTIGEAADIILATAST